jgi:hypothetical protein
VNANDKLANDGPTLEVWAMAVPMPGLIVGPVAAPPTVDVNMNVTMSATNVARATTPVRRNG